MKYGLCYFRDSINIGDDVLTYAAKRFLPHIDYYIDRESLDTFVPETEEAVSVILNGWYLWNPYTFPPSPYINPLFVGTHFSPSRITQGYEHLDDNVTEYLKTHGPIGCRDHSTKVQMDKRGIDSNFSACLTLTIQPPEGNYPKSDIILSDITSPVTEYVIDTFTDREISFTTHDLNGDEIGKDWDDFREKRVTDLLGLYSNANLVITSRLHAALPCLAMGTPVILIGRFDDDFNNRIGSFQEYLPMLSPEEFLSGEWDSLVIDGPKNSPPTEKINALVTRCQDFIKDCENNPPESNYPPHFCIQRTIYRPHSSYAKRNKLSYRRVGISA